MKTLKVKLQVGEIERDGEAGKRGNLPILKST